MLFGVDISPKAVLICKLKNRNMCSYFQKGSDQNMLDRHLFIYLTKKAGYTLQDVAKLWGLENVSGVYKRLTGEVELRRSEMESWMDFVGVRDAGPIFFPRFVAETKQEGTAAAGGAYG